MTPVEQVWNRSDKLWQSGSDWSHCSHHTTSLSGSNNNTRHFLLSRPPVTSNIISSIRIAANAMLLYVLQESGSALVSVTSLQHEASEHHSNIGLCTTSNYQKQAHKSSCLS